MTINTDFLTRCIDTLESAFERLKKLDPSDRFYDICRAASVKKFEIVLEQSGSLLKKRMRPYFASNRHADRLTFKNVFRHAARHDVISVEACERWFAYRDNRNDAAHDYGESLPKPRSSCFPSSSSMPEIRQESSLRATMTDQLRLPQQCRRVLGAEEIEP